MIDLVRYFYEHPVIRYLFSGGLAALTLFGALYFFGEILGLWYIWASTIASVLAFITSFLLQKLFTFKNRQVEGAHKQFVIFVLIGLFNLGANAFLMYIFVDKFEWWYMLAQFITLAIISTWNYFLYKALFTRSAKVNLSTYT
jgi:putative flippase GtrA